MDIEIQGKDRKRGNNGRRDSGGGKRGERGADKDIVSDESDKRNGPSHYRIAKGIHGSSGRSDGGGKGRECRRAHGTRKKSARGELDAEIP